jgi:signal transduction histidine kinase/ActR/RegA family two-component response regulator
VLAYDAEDRLTEKAMPDRSDEFDPLARVREAPGSVRGRLTLLIVALVIVSGFVAAVVAVDDYLDHRDAMERHLGETANALSLAVDGQMQAAVSTVEALATSPDLQSGRLAGFEAQARRAAPETDRWVMLADDRGRWLINTALPPDRVLPAMSPALFGEVVRKMGPERPWISDRLIPNIHGQPGVGVAVRVRGPGQPLLYLGLGMDATAAQKIVSRQGLPPNWYALLLDRDRRVIAYAGRTRTLAPESAAKLAEYLRRSPDRGEIPALSFDNRPTLAAYRRSPFTGWTLIVAVPMAEVDSSLIRSLALVVAAVIGLLALGVALAFELSRGVAKAVHVLCGAAEVLGDGVYEGAAATGLRETDGVARAIQGASVRLEARERELRQLNQTLEARVAERTHELAAANERLAEARKLEAVGRIAGGVAHDFNNLLTVVIGSFDLLGKRLTDESLKKLVAHGSEAAGRGATLTKRLLAFGRRQRLEPEPLDLNALVEDAAALITKALGPNLGARTAPGQPPLWAIADRSQLQDAMMSLVSNARDAMSEGGGEVVIATGRETVAEAAASPVGPPPGEYAVLSVRDSGAGMTPEMAAQMWEPFFSTKGRGVGSGLGLSQVLGMARQLGGGVAVETAPERGTCVSVYLPLAEPAVSAAEAAAPAADLAACKVLLVDDDADVRRMTAALLADLGCLPEEAICGDDALDRLEKSAPDIVITDYAMPGMTGAELGRRLAALRPDLPVLIISGYMDVEALERTWTGPVLAKPFDRRELAARLAQTLASGAAQRKEAPASGA